MKSTKLVVLNGVIGNIRGFKKMGKLRLKETRGLKCNKSKSSVKPAKSTTDFLVAILDDGMAKEVLGKVVSCTRKLGG